MEKIFLSLVSKIDSSYYIHIGNDIFDYIVEQIAGLDKTSYAIITDSNVRSIYAESFFKRLQNRIDASKVVLIEFPAGEDNKNRYWKARIEDVLIENGFDRGSVVIALGGGVVGDLAGFVASTYYRGIPYIQIPTTLLAQVDASVGGKTAINTVHGKNLIGSFYQPIAVYIDLNTLNTLNKREIKSGLGEVIKYALIADKDFLGYIETNKEKIDNMENEVILHIVKRCCEIKADIVAKDERESGLRQILNYGHTIGHALEKISDYSISHGEAVGFGMIVASIISNMLNILGMDELDRHISILKYFDIVSNIPSVSVDNIIKSAIHDKKAMGGKIKYVILKDTGNVYKRGNNYSFEIDTDIVAEAIKRAFEYIK